VAVATFNIRHASLDGRIGRAHPLAAAVRTLGALGADIVALQEVDRHVVRSGFADQARVAADALGGHAAFSPARRLARGWYGNALVTRAPLHDVEHIALPAPSGTEPRVALIASVGVGDGATRLTVCCTHLHNAADAAASQLDWLLVALADRPRPLLLAGDLNLERAQFAPRLASAGFVLPAETPTFPRHAPQRQIDVVAVSGGALAAARTVDIALSDHRPILVELLPS
jgi:endonuclease/exonuclease/phosphatase family metal-dependent hydrolase